MTVLCVCSVPLRLTAPGNSAASWVIFSRHYGIQVALLYAVVSVSWDSSFMAVSAKEHAFFFFFLLIG